MILSRYTNNIKHTGTRTKRVLLVEDEPLYQQLHFLMLEELGCTVDVAENGEQALLKATSPYDIIFMDIGLPDIRGTAVVHKLRHDKKSKQIKTPIIILTAYPKNEIEKESFSSGASAVFTKPISSKIIKEILKQYVPKNAANVG